MTHTPVGDYADTPDATLGGASRNSPATFGEEADAQLREPGPSSDHAAAAEAFVASAARSANGPGLAERLAEANSGWASSVIWTRDGDRLARLLAELDLVLGEAPIEYLSAEITDSEVDSDCAYSLSIFSVDLVIHASGNAEHLWSTVSVRARRTLKALMVTTAPVPFETTPPATNRMTVELRYDDLSIVIPGEASAANMTDTRLFLPSLLDDVRA